MFTSMISRLGLKGLVAGSALSLMPTAAFARHHGDVRIDLPLPGPVVVVDQPACQPGRVWVAPVVQTVDQQQWIAPVYQTVTEQVFVPEARTVQCTKVYLPDQYGYQNVVEYDRRGYGHYVQQRVLVSAAHYEDRQQSVAVPAHYENQSRQVLIADGHFQSVPVQQVVVPGHWQAVEAPVVERHEEHGLRVELRLPF